MQFKPFPIGVDDFEKLITNGYYYVDKTLLIKELLDMKGEVNLFTRPRRFGKSLTISMLKCFFEISESSPEKLFSGLKIMGQGQRCLRHMGAYPVIMLSLKSTKQDDFRAAYAKIAEAVGGEFRRHKILLQSEKLDETQKERYLRILEEKAERVELMSALKFLSEVLYGHYGQKAIILIDEYDVPLEHAYFTGYYDQMSSFIRAFFEEGLKSNPFMEFAVVTGCLRITKETNFTGLNNLKINSILGAGFDEYFGFLQPEVDEMADFYGIQGENGRELIKKWYDGYTFGLKDVYNPWSVINYLESVYVNNCALPKPYWANTSSNKIIRTLVDRADLSVKEELERLIGGGTIEKPIHEDITYDDIDKSEDNLWNFLFFTGYLKMCGQRLIGDTIYITMAIPNTEIRYIYKNKILEWFRQRLTEKNLEDFYNSIVSSDVGKFQAELTKLLRESISFYDNKEAFYHGFLLGLLERMNGYAISSNQESGDGRYDILLKSPDIENVPILFELKLADSYKEMESAAERAVRQINERHYGEELGRDGYEELVCFGIAFYKKNCVIRRKVHTF